MKAFVLAAGLGSRLKGYTKDKPKVMLEVAGEKILERTLKLLSDAGVPEVVINLHYLPEVITKHFGDGSRHGLKIYYSHEPTLLGSAGGLKKVQSHFTEPFLVVYGDNVFDLNIKKFVDAARPPAAPAHMALFHRHKNPNSGAAGGVVEIDEKGFVKGFWEGVSRPEINYVNSGVYVLTPEIFSHIPENTFYDFGKNVFPDLLAKNIPIKAYILDENEGVFGIDTEEYLQNTENYFRNKI